MVEVTGHRGAAGLEPENTLRSFRRAVELGVDAVELDVHLSLDDELIVMHDARVDRTTNGKGWVRDLRSEQIRRLDAGLGEHVPILQEVIDLVLGKAAIQIELKGKGTEAPTVRLIEANRCEAQVRLTSFDHRRVKSVKALNPSIRTGVLFACRPIDPVRLAKDADADALHIHHAMVDQELVAAAHAAGLRVAVWNIDDPDEAEAAAALGVDAVGTNRPDIVTERLRRKRYR
ncbi:MAG: glycerophosphodiester phosphodiesterase family protein [Candidatus Bathyarchaeia archaeon]